MHQQVSYISNSVSPHCPFKHFDMTHRCSSSLCSCGMYNQYQYNNNYHNDSCSMLFCTPNNGGGTYYGVDDDMGSFATTSSVDCTLSLATPSTRSMGENSKDKKQSSLLSSFWNMVPSRNAMPPQTAAGRSHRGGASNGGDPLFARRCANCDTTSTPLWRNGPRGPKSLCNACGIRFKKEQRRATAAAAAAVADVGQNQRMGCYPSTEYRFVEDDDHRPDADSSGIPFLSWRFNVTDRSSFVHDFTR